MKVWGLLAEYNEPEEILEGAKKARSAGYSRLNAYTPFPVEDLWEHLGKPKTKIQWIILAAGMTGGIGGFFMQWYLNVVDWPWNVGGRPLNSWPSFMPVTFELTVLFAAFAAVFGMLGLNGLPEPHHPVFNCPEFQRASKDKFFLCVNADDSKFDRSGTESFLKSIGAHHVHEVPA